METINTFRMSANVTTALSATMKLLTDKVYDLGQKIEKGRGQLFFSPVEAAQFLESMVDDSKALDTHFHTLLKAYNECAEVLLPFMEPKASETPLKASEKDTLISVPDFLAQQQGNLVKASVFSDRLRRRREPEGYGSGVHGRKTALWSGDFMQEVYDQIPDRQIVPDKKLSLSDFMDQYEFHKDKDQNLRLRSGFRANVSAIGLEGELDQFRVKVYSVQKLERALNNWCQIMGAKVVKK